MKNTALINQLSVYGHSQEDTQRFWNHSKNLSQKHASRIRCFLVDRNDRALIKPHDTIEHAHEYCLEAFRENEKLSQNQGAAEFKKRLHERLVGLSTSQI